jgi:hypothetical protein
MLRATAIGIVSILALGVGLATPAAAAGGHPGGGSGGAGGTAYGISAGGGSGAVHDAGAGRGSMMAARSDFSPARLADHDMGRMRMGGDRDHDRDHDHDRGRDHDRDRHDHDRFRFLPAFAFGVNTYADTYDSTYGDCWELHRVWTHAGWRLRRYWVCD